MGGRRPVCSVYIGIYRYIYIGINAGKRKEAGVKETCALLYRYIEEGGLCTPISPLTAAGTDTYIDICRYIRRRVFTPLHLH